MPTIITRSDKGAALTHAEMDQNLVNLNEGIGAVEAEMDQNLVNLNEGIGAVEAEMDQSLVNLNERIGAVEADTLLKLQIIPEADYMARAAANRDRYAGSGFVEWGKHSIDSRDSHINEGLWVRDISSQIANTIFLGINSTSRDGVSKSINAIVNVNGNTLHLKAINETTASSTQANILLPPAPSVSTMLERQDLVFLEVFHEKIADKDIVYPYGNTQSLLATDPSTGLSTGNGSFTGYGTYSLFGNWQNSGDIIGKGIVWSTMSEADKKAFVSDPTNNVYLAEDGTYVQVRYRIRVIEGLGVNWRKIKAEKTDLFAYDSLDNYVQAKGSTVSLAADLSSSASPAVFYGAGHTNGLSDGSFYHAGSGGAINSSIAYKGQCFALPIALVSRRNQGGFHPVFNPNGSRAFINSAQTAYAHWYQSLFSEPVSAADCFNVGTVASGAYVSQGTGAIGLASGRPDGKFYDAIYESDVLDLRNSANKPLDLNRCLEREFSRLVVGEMRGWQEVAVSMSYSGTADANTSTMFRIGGWHEEDIAVPYGEVIPKERLLYYVVNETTGIGKACRLADAYSRLTALDDSAFVTTGDTIRIFNTSRDLDGIYNRAIPSKTPLHCDIIGDPANYPQEWKDNGVMGTPLLVGENGEDYTLDQVFAIGAIKLSRKSNGAPLLILGSTNGGVNWSNITANSVGADFNSSSNSIGYLDMSSFDLAMVFYLTEASPFETADNAEVLSLGDVWFGAYYTYTIVSHLIGKVPTMSSGTYAYSTSNLKYFINPTTKEIYDGGVSGVHIEHDSRYFLPSGPSAKTCAILTKENGKLCLQLIFKEMIVDTTLGDDDAFSNIVGGISTTTDDNGNTVLIGQQRVELPYFVEDAA